MSIDSCKERKRAANKKHHDKIKLDPEKRFKKLERSRLAKLTFEMNLNRKIEKYNYSHSLNLNMVFKPVLMFSEIMLLICGRFMCVNDIAKLIIVSRAVHDGSMYYIMHVLNSLKLRATCSKVFQSMYLPAPQSAIDVYNYIHVKTLFEIDRWDNILILETRLRIKAVFETQEGRIVNPTEYIGYIVAYVQGMYMIFYDDFDIRYESQPYIFLLQFAVNDDGQYINEPVV